MSKDLRKSSRVVLPGMVRLTWQDANGCQKFTRGRCLDLSASGIRVEVPEPIPLRSYVTVKLENVDLTSSASVRHVGRLAGKYWVGLEFSCPLRRLSARLEKEAQAAAETPSPVKSL